MSRFVKNPYGESEVTNSSLSRDLQRRMDAGEFQITQPEQPKSFGAGVLDNFATQDRGAAFTAIGSEALGRIVTPDSESKTLRRKLGEDASVLAFGIPMFLEQLITNPIKTIKETPGAMVQSVKDTFDPDYYKAHPGLGVVNAVANATVVGGLVKSGVMGSVRSSAFRVTSREASTLGLNMGVRGELGTFSRLNANEKALHRSVDKAAETGDIRFVSETVSSIASRNGATIEQAGRLAQNVADEVARNLSRQNVKLRIIDPIAHPVKATGNLIRQGTDPIRRAVLGDPANTAVAILYGNERVMKNPSAYLDIERWAGAQVTEKGMANTIANRQKVMQEWTETNPTWSYLTPEERLAYHQNYVRTDMIRKKLHEMTGVDVVTTKALPPQFVESMIDTIKSNSERLSPKGVLDLLEDVYGADIRVHRGVLDEVLSKTGNKSIEALTKAIEALGKPRSLVSFERFSPEVRKLADDLVGSGYRVGAAPKGKAVSFASDLTKTPGLAPDQLTKRTFIGRFMDEFGLSARGTVEGAVEYFYRENFTQKLLGEFREKYGNKVKFDGVTIPIEKLYDYLDKNKNTIRQAAGATPGIRSRFAAFSVFDLKTNDFKKAGMSDNMARDLDRIGRESLSQVPLSQVGIGDKVVNYLRSRSQGYNKWMSDWYDTYIKVAYKGRYDLNPMFAAQQYIETISMSALLFKDPRGAFSMVGANLGSTKLGRWTADKLYKKSMEMKTVTRELVNPGELPINQVKLVQDELLAPLHKEMANLGNSSEWRVFDSIANERMPGVDTLRGKAMLENQATSNNFWLRVFGYSHVRSMTIMNRGLAQKYGMTLEDALGYTVNQNGTKTYKNPAMVQMMKDLSQAAVHYDKGFLTSPLIKTMNIIWFPFRFNAKTTAVTAKWLGGLPPGQRMAVLSNWMHFSNWITTEEGQEWRRGNRSLFGRFLQYSLAFDMVGETADAVSRGQLFGGNTGLLGGIPFGFLVNIATNLGYKAEDPDQFNPATGKPFQRTVPRDPASLAGLTVATEELLFSILPGMPFYTLSGGAIRGANPRNMVSNLVRGVIGGTYDAVEDKRSGTGQKLIERQFMNVPHEYTRFDFGRSDEEESVYIPPQQP